jgi:predicted PurR-regulated permease PerM
MSNNRFYLIVLVSLVLLLGYLSYQILKPFLSPIAWAIVLSMVFYPLYVFILRFIKWKPLASFVTLCVILLILLGPFSYLSYLLSQELKSLVDSIEAGRLVPMKDLLQHPGIKVIINKILSIFNVTETELQKTIVDNITRLGKESINIVTSGLGNVALAVLDFILMILSIFFLLEDGPEFLEKIGNYMPFSKRQRDKLIKQIKDIIISTIYGGVTVAIVQGVIGGIAFSILGIPSPVVWGLSIFITSFIPIVGTFVIWGPAVGYLFLQGSVFKGIILILIGVFGISAVDNILRPLIIRGRIKMPTLVIFFSILGGIKLFGFIGFIMGPLILALFVSVVEILRYTEEEKKMEI